MNEPLIYNIQKYSIHDGDGIRTTVFFKGCPLRCKWCHNPESQSYKREMLFYRERCVECGTCKEYCQNEATTYENGIKIDYSKCTGCGICTEYCYQGARELAGQQYTIDRLIEKLKKDAMFYEESDGGVTLSGGEVMAQNMEYIEELVKKLHKKGFNVAVDTCGYCSYDNFRRVLPYVDTFLYDIKVIDPEKHQKYTGVENHIILENLVKLSRDGAKIELRMPLIAGINDSSEDIIQTIQFIKRNEVCFEHVYLLPYHDTGKDKYVRLSRNYVGEKYCAPTQKKLQKIISIFKENDINNIRIGG